MPTLKTEILGFTTKAWKGGKSREHWLKNGKEKNITSLIINVGEMERALIYMSMEINTLENRKKV